MAKNILIADDSDSIRSILKLTLNLKGYNVEETDNGKAAYELLSKNQYDLLISDIDMPHLTGIELLVKIRSELNNKTIPIIICTAEKLSNESDILSKGASKIIAKPFAPNDLLRVVGELIN